MSLFTSASSQKHIKGSWVYKSTLTMICKIDTDNDYQDEKRVPTQPMFCTRIQTDMYYDLLTNTPV